MDFYSRNEGQRARDDLKTLFRNLADTSLSKAHATSESIPPQIKKFLKTILTHYYPVGSDPWNEPPERHLAKQFLLDRLAGSNVTLSQTAKKGAIRYSLLNKAIRDMTTSISAEISRKINLDGNRKVPLFEFTSQLDV